MARRPFPQHVVYDAGILIPDHVGRMQLDDSVRSFYTAWKKHYLRKGCHEGEYYVWFEERGAKRCVSEGQGYGMLIVALMAGADGAKGSHTAAGTETAAGTQRAAGADTAARAIYDGLFRYCRAHPAAKDSLLMAWAQQSDCRDLDGGTATDGDMDIAYSLLLADAQWGSRGAIDYADEARRMTAVILKREINQKNFSVLLGDEIEPDSKDYNDMRSSDFMPAHFRVFARASGNPAWDTVRERGYRLFRSMQDKYSPGAGLLPDFINHIATGAAHFSAIPARPHYLESRYDGCYYYNACRVPLRIGADLILNRDSRARLMLEKINRWIRSTTKENPDNISAGYDLDGNDLPHHYFEALSFIMPFAISAMAGRGPGSQAWLNNLWDYIVHFRLRQFDYYDNSIKMIGLIMLSGNYWEP